MERTERETDSCRLDSDCSTTPTCDGRHGRIRIQIGAFKYFMEPSWSQFSYGFRLVSISILRLPQYSVYCREDFCPGCWATLFWPIGPCITLGPLWTHPRVGTWPWHPCGCPPPIIYSLAAARTLGFLLDASLAFATSLLFFPVVQKKPKKICRLVDLQSYKPFEPFLVLLS